MFNMPRNTFTGYHNYAWAFSNDAKKKKKKRIQTLFFLLFNILQVQISTSYLNTIHKKVCKTCLKNDGLFCRKAV